MEIAKLEVQAVEEALVNAGEIQFEELTDLQLALVGGGSGDVVFG